MHPRQLEQTVGKMRVATVELIDHQNRRLSARYTIQNMNIQILSPTHTFPFLRTMLTVI